MAIVKGLDDYNTPEYRAEYARKTRELAAAARATGNLDSEKFLLWVASNYDKPVDNR